MSVSFQSCFSIEIYPNICTSISELVLRSLQDDVTKLCNTCISNTYHLEESSFEQFPNILVVLIKRFSFDYISRKNKTEVKVQTQLGISSERYELLGSIHHHGTSSRSGHYTSQIYYTNVAYACNDCRIGQISPVDENSKSAYLVFYKRIDTQ